jgi:hypothetical protein
VYVAEKVCAPPTVGLIVVRNVQVGLAALAV